MSTRGPEFRLEDLRDRIREKRRQQNLSIRGAAAEAGVSFSTFTRVESGAQPDLATFLALCAWLEDPPERFFATSPSPPQRGIELAIRHLATDPRLSKRASRTIAGVVRELYEALARDIEEPHTMAMHLRAAHVMRPGVPERLASILRDMRTSLDARTSA